VTTIALLLLALAVAVSLVWRAAARHWSLPCPSWLVPLLENPYFEAVAGADTVLTRAGVRSGMSVLDAGCGPGRLTLPAAERVGPAGRVVGLDVQARMIERLRRRVRAQDIANVDAVLAGLGTGQLPPAAFDVALLVTVLGEIPHKAAALREIHDALRPGGVLSVTEVLPDPHYQTVARVRALANAAGFHEQRLYAGVVSFTMNFVKESGG
jgi:ubiquinone/menaquinone biosynthesis C-methylase UbiE